MSPRAGLVVITSSILLLALVANQASVARGAPVSATSCLDTPVQCSISASEAQVAFAWPDVGQAKGLGSSPSTTTTPAAVTTHETEVLEPRSWWSRIKHTVSHVAKVAAAPITSTVHAAMHPISTIKNVAHAVTHPIATIKHQVNHVVHQVRHAVHTIKSTVKTAAHVVRDTAHFIKKNGPTIAKIGLKMLASSQGIVGAVAKVVPGVGIPLSKALQAGAKGMDMASNMIHAPVPGAWKTAMKVMEFAENPVANGLKAAGVNGAVGAAASMILG